MMFKNSLSGEVESFHPIRGKRVNMYVCGPTVQESFHIGHARTYIIFDSIAKYMRLSGYSVFYLQNITDIDDKIIKKAQDLCVDYQDVALKYTSEYFDIMHELGVDSVNFYARATEYIPEIISQISRLMEKGHAYIGGDGVYFRVGSFPDYGRLSRQKSEDLLQGNRISENYDKDDEKDFALWKMQKPGEPAWESPWGMGRPGWHIEDTAITETYFGQEYDIHGGGSDLIFPHHEAEIAQMRSISGKETLAKYWIHTGMVTLNGLKMSKSLGNFITISETLKKHNGREIRFALINANYRSTIDFSEKVMEEAEKNVRYLNIIKRRLDLHGDVYGNLDIDAATYKERVKNAMDNDFDFRSAIRIIMDLAATAYREFSNLSFDSVRSILSVFKWADTFLGIFEYDRNPEALKKSVNLLLDLRKKLREDKNYSLSDFIRVSLVEMGVEVQDNGKDVEWWIRD
ncbi:cysteine--tRNA ligase [Oxyplasma meridianum]|uniref:Cysteine--tRNA ligase n=1 Tax=Oxyplasma meridianum TaxID=3073602 RepID=A0AAX4NGS6_9ARCH